MKKTVVIGFAGSTLDSGPLDATRWNRWRPSVALAMQEDLRIERFELIHGNVHQSLAEMLRTDIAQVSPDTQVNTHVMDFRDPWDFEEVYGQLLDFSRRYPFDPDTEDYLVHITTGTHVAQICLFLLTEARYLPGRLLQSQPARGKPAGPGKWGAIDLDLSRYDSITSRFANDHAVGASLLKSGIETRNVAFNALIDEIEQVAGRTKAPILLSGPTGAGKSQLARKIFQLKKNRHQLAGPLVEVNCATLKGDSAMSALFGHKKGAFTGAASDRSGLLKAADRGLLFLDEIGELGLDEQAMILRAIEEKRFLPLGSDIELQSDFQLIAGTNRDLYAAVRKGEFREDLLARLGIWSYIMPGLSDRREDIEPNLDYELDRFAQAEGIRVSFNKEAREKYLAFAKKPDSTWLGNFRDLGSSVSRMATLSDSGRIGTTDVKIEIRRLQKVWAGGSGSSGECLLSKYVSDDEMAQIDLFDVTQLNEVIRVCRASRSLSEAGRLLFAASRLRRCSVNDADRLSKYLARFELSWDAIHNAQ